MCHNRELDAGLKNLMDIALFRAIIDEARQWANDVYLHHRGEPLLHPQFFDMIRYARRAGLRTRFHTNGCLLDTEKTERLLDAGPDLVSFSVDGFEKSIYEAIRVGACFDETVENIIRLVSRRRDRRLRKPYVVVERIRFRHSNVPEDPAAVAALRQRFLEAGVDEVIEKEEYVWAVETAPETAAPRRLSACTFPWYAMVICADGTVTPCPQDFYAKLVMGRWGETSLREIWNGPAYRDLRRRYQTDIESLPLCRKCDRLCRKTVARSVPLQYAITFLTDHLLGYGRLRAWIGTAERKGVELTGEAERPGLTRGFPTASRTSETRRKPSSRQ